MQEMLAIVGAVKAASQLAGGLFDRSMKFREASLDEAALRRMLLLELQYNLALLEVAVGQKKPLPSAALWKTPALLNCETLEGLLGSSKEATAVARALKNLKIDDRELINETSGVIANLYSRIIALKGLAVLNNQVGLDRVKIALRLENLRNDMLLVRAAIVQNKSVSARAQTKTKAKAIEAKSRLSAPQ